MKGVFKCTALAVALGLMGSSAAMAAVVKGGTIDSGAGSITVHGVVIDDTCSVNLPDKELTASIPMSKLKGSTENTVLATLNSDLTLNHCEGKPVALALTSGTYTTNVASFYPDGTTYSSSPVNAQVSLVQTDGINWIANGAPGAAYGGQVLELNGHNSVVFTPKGDSSTFTMVNKIRAGNSVPVSKAEAKSYDFTYTYNLTYL
ncbi:hypothetical protein QCA22_004781 [Salmonella enterica]|nr:hypothetical protein [Salmonella enterica]EKS5829922.1 hypothetical protein [Salmonella enterica]EKS5881073.1 hypothetical protein [Salmonella enterica]